MIDTVIQEEQDVMLTTTDNPFNPKTDYDKWKQWDEDNGYNTESYLARLVMTSVEDLDDDIAVESATNQAMKDIVEYDVLGVYVLV